MLRDGSGGGPGTSDVAGGDTAAGFGALTNDGDRIGAATLTASSGGAPAGEPGVVGLRRWDAGELALLCRDELVGVLGDIERQANRLAGYRVEVLGALDELSGSGAASDATPHLTVRAATGVSDREARRMRRVAAKVRGNKEVLGALSGGGINAAQAEALSDARVPEAVRDELVIGAAAQDTDATRRCIREAETLHSAESPTERFLRQRAARGAGWGRDHDGMVKLWAKFDPETGARIEAALEPLRRALWQQDKQMRTGRRTPAQRDADALAYALAGVTLTDADAQVVDDLAARARQNGRASPSQPGGASPSQPGGASPSQPGGASPSQPGGASPSQPGSGRTAPDQPQSRRTTPRGAPRPDGECESGDKRGRGLSGNFEPGPARSAATRPAAPDELTDQLRWLPSAQISVLIGLEALRGQTDEAGLSDAGTELAPETVRRLACDTEIIPIILGGPGGPADIGRARRTVPARLRRLLIARDRHCRWPGCHAPPSRCDAHHIIHWARGGPTDLDNLLLLCHTHHHHLHEHGYEPVACPDGTWTFTPERTGTQAATPALAQRPRAP
ncbi:DUF222 domain-containing protein [Candidatus Poriferisodalis sp.]|uniref:HNH endonuclease signature motif containing protein n=1 Tax=Candidatus Poriferisodalis sp. TaxID=3101277 RepID=UPI003B5A46B5